MPILRQPLLHSETVVLRAPTQVWSSPDGDIGSASVHGIYFGDLRIAAIATVRLGDSVGEAIARAPAGADVVTFVSVQRHLDDSSPDPRLRMLRTRTATITGAREELLVESQLDEPLRTMLTLRLRPDLTSIDAVKSGVGSASTPPIHKGTDAGGAGLNWGSDSLRATLTAVGATMTVLPTGEVEAVWSIDVPTRGSFCAEWSISVADGRAVVVGVDRPPSWSIPKVEAADDRLGRWLSQALADLSALRLSSPAAPDEVFLAAGAPWFFTLFGRDAIWAARMMLPLGTTLAGDTLRALARLQGTSLDTATAEEPGKIMHELRRDGTAIPHEAVQLPPLYYGTVDATPLWICLLYDAWQWGLPDDAIRKLLPCLESALAWMRDYGDADGDGLLEYVDLTGRGLANQGWKDSGDSVQWRDGTLADGPIALCEVQAYAYQAARHGAELLDHFGRSGGGEWRSWADALAARFHAAFWISSPQGDYPAIALDAEKRPVDTVTSNLGHLLGTGLLDGEQAALVARRLLSPELHSGYGLRTMSSDSSGYWPLSYHGGSVWTHDSAIAVAGLVAEGYTEEAGQIIDGLLAAAAAFDYRMPELHSGDARNAVTSPIPYPAACQPQAWSAAAAISILTSVLGLQPNAPGGTLGVQSTAGPLTPLTVHGLRFAGAPVSVRIDASGSGIVLPAQGPQPA